MGVFVMVRKAKEQQTIPTVLQILVNQNSHLRRHAIKVLIDGLLHHSTVLES